MIQTAIKNEEDHYFCWFSESSKKISFAHYNRVITMCRDVYFVVDMMEILELNHNISQHL